MLPMVRVGQLSVRECKALLVTSENLRMQRYNNCPYFYVAVSCMLERILAVWLSGNALVSINVVALRHDG